MFLADGHAVGDVENGPLWNLEPLTLLSAMAHGLWYSWAGDAVLADPGGKYANSEKIRPIMHEGEYFRVDGPLNVPSSPQGRPVLFQAGASAPGRDPEQVLIMPGLVTYIGSTKKAAAAAQEAADSHLPVENSLAQLAAGGGHCTMLGTPEEIADGIEQWFVHGGADGFNLMPPILPGSLEEFVAGWYQCCSGGACLERAMKAAPCGSIYSPLPEGHRAGNISRQ